MHILKFVTGWLTLQAGETLKTPVKWRAFLSVAQVILFSWSPQRSQTPQPSLPASMEKMRLPYIVLSDTGYLENKRFDLRIGMCIWTGIPYASLRACSDSFTFLGIWGPLSPSPQGHWSSLLGKALTWIPTAEGFSDHFIVRAAALFVPTPSSLTSFFSPLFPLVSNSGDCTLFLMWNNLRPLEPY